MGEKWGGRADITLTTASLEDILIPRRDMENIEKPYETIFERRQHVAQLVDCTALDKVHKEKVLFNQ